MIYDNWKLTYLGTGEDAYSELIKTIEGTLPDYSTLAEDVVVTQSVIGLTSLLRPVLSPLLAQEAIIAAITATQEGALAVWGGTSLSGRPM